MGRPSQADLMAFQLSQSAHAPTSMSREDSLPGLSDSYSSPPSSPEIPRRKYISRSAVARRGVDEEAEEDLEDELNDFGYGSSRKPQKKESLMDLLNSEPPSWMMEPAPAIPVAVPSRKVNVLQKMRLSRAPSTKDDDSSFSTLKNGLRGSKSSSSLLGSLKSKSSITIQDEEDDFARSFAPATRQLSASGGPPRKKLSAKDAAPVSRSNRDLVDFLKTSAPPSSFDATPTPSRPTRRNSRRGRSSTTGSFDGSKSVRSAMERMGAVGRRSSLARSDSNGAETIKENESLASNMFASSIWQGLHGEQSEETLQDSTQVDGQSRDHHGRKGSSSAAGSPALHRSTSTLSTSYACHLRLGRIQADLLYCSDRSARRLSRKPPPRADDVDTSPASSPITPRKKAPISDNVLAALMVNADRGEDDTSPIAVGESPVKGRESLVVERIKAPDRSSTSTFGPPSPRDPPAMTSKVALPSNIHLNAPSPTQESTAVPQFNPKRLSRSIPNGRSSSPVPSTASRSRRPTSPPPDAPLPTTPNESNLVATRPPRSRPVSVVFQPPIPLGQQHLSIVKGVPEQSLRHQSSVDSLLDPPLSTSTRTDRSRTVTGSTYQTGDESVELADPVLEGLRLLKLSMGQTVMAMPDFSREPTAEEVTTRNETPTGTTSLSRKHLDALLPTLMGIQNQMQQAAKLIELVVRLAEVEKGEERNEREEMAVASFLLDGEVEPVRAVVEEQQEEEETEEERMQKEVERRESEMELEAKSKESDGGGNDASSTLAVVDDAASHRSSESDFPLLVKDLQD